MVCAYTRPISGEHLQHHWSSGLKNAFSEFFENH